MLIVALVAGGGTMLALGCLALVVVLCCCKRSKSSHPRPNAFAKLGHLRGQRASYALTPYDASDADESDEVEEDYPRPRRACKGSKPNSKGRRGTNGLLALPAPAGDMWFEQLVGESQGGGAFPLGTVARV